MPAPVRTIGLDRFDWLLPSFLGIEPLGRYISVTAYPLPQLFTGV